MEPIRVLNMFTIMNRGGAETMVMNYYRRLDKSKIQFDFLVHREERGAYGRKNIPDDSHLSSEFWKIQEDAERILHTTQGVPDYPLAHVGAGVFCIP